MNSSSVFLLVNIQVTNAFTMIKEPGISSAASALLASGDVSAFQQQYGDMFVRGLQTGGCFFGVIEIETSSQTDQQSLSVKVSAAYGPFGGSGTFSDSFKQAVSDRNVKVTCHIEGGVIPQPLPTNVDSLISAASSWPRTVNNQAVPYTAMLDGYGVLPLPNPPNYIDLQHQQDVLNQCSFWRNQDLLTLNDIDYIVNNQGQFLNLNIVQLDQLQNQITQDLNTIAAAASNALDNPAQAKLPVLQLPPPVQLPQRVVAPVVTGISPATGRAGGGDIITVTGTGFTGATAVSFGSVAAMNLAVASDGQLTVTSPAPTASGTTIDVTVTTPAGTSATSAADKFTYAVAAPVVTGISPATGRAGGGDIITVTGTGFTGATAVSFGSVAAMDLAVASDGQLTVTSPAPTASGTTIDVTVTTPAGTSATSAADKFTYAPPPLKVLTTSLPEATCGAAYGAQLQASGGTGPLSWALQSGSLPIGLSLNPAGVISGAPAPDQGEPVT